MRTILALAAILGGCATVYTPPPGTAPAPAPEPESAARTETIAIASLLDGARADTAAGRLANAAASLERALRIQPRNPRLWQEPARVRPQPGDYARAEGPAARSNPRAGGCRGLSA